MFERFTDRARKVMALANQEAQRFNHEYIGTEHMLLGLVKEGSGVGATVLKRLGVDLPAVRVEVERLVGSRPSMITMGKLPQTPEAKRVIEEAIIEARGFDHDYVGTEHLLLGLLHDPETVAGRILRAMGLTADEVREEVLSLLGVGHETAESSGASTVAAGRARDPGAGACNPNPLRFTNTSRRLMAIANVKAQGLRHHEVGTEHLLLALAGQDAGVFAALLRAAGVAPMDIVDALDKLFGAAKAQGEPPPIPPLTANAKQVIEFSIEEARLADSRYVHTGHLLLALLREEAGTASQVLSNLRLEVETLRETLTAMGDAAREA